MSDVQIAKKRSASREECLNNWPDARAGEFNPSCCRFPKLCSCPEADEVVRALEEAIGKERRVIERDVDLARWTDDELRDELQRRTDAKMRRERWCGLARDINDTLLKPGTLSVRRGEYGVIIAPSYISAFTEALLQMTVDGVTLHDALGMVK